MRANKARQKLKPFAGVGVADRRREKDEAEDQHEDVQHEMLLKCSNLRSERDLLALVGMKCHPAHRFSRRE